MTSKNYHDKERPAKFLAQEILADSRAKILERFSNQTMEVMQGINVISGVDAENIINWIVNIYQDKYQSGFFNMVDPKPVKIIYIDGVGGCICDLVYNGNNKSIARMICNFIAIEESERGKGYGRKRIKALELFGIKQGTPFIGAYVECQEQIEIWRAFGYKVQSNIGYTLTMFKKPLRDIFNV